MEERIEVFAAFAREQAEEQDKLMEDFVHEMIHESYLMKYTTGDMLRDLGELEEVYPDAF
jgi:hypothetical protein